MGNRIGVSKNWLTTFLGIHNYIRVITKVLQNAWKHKNTHTHIYTHIGTTVPENTTLINNHSDFWE